jgi:hypothetical protein
LLKDTGAITRSTGENGIVPFLVSTVRGLSRTRRRRVAHMAGSVILGARQSCLQTPTSFDVIHWISRRHRGTVWNLYRMPGAAGRRDSRCGMMQHSLFKRRMCGVGKPSCTSRRMSVGQPFNSIPNRRILWLPHRSSSIQSLESCPPRRLTRVLLNLLDKPQGCKRPASQRPLQVSRPRAGRGRHIHDYAYGHREQTHPGDR